MIPHLLTLAILLMIPPFASAQRKQPSRQPIIDVHMHNYSTDELLKNQARDKESSNESHQPLWRGFARGSQVTFLQLAC